MTTRRFWWISAVVAGLLCAPEISVFGQEAEENAPSISAVENADSDTPAPESDGAQPPAEPDTAADTPAAEPDAPADSPDAQLPADAAAPADPDLTDAPSTPDASATSQDAADVSIDADAAAADGAAGTPGATTPPTAAGDEAAAAAATDDAAAEATGNSTLDIVKMLAIIATVFVVPVLIGRYLATLWKMPDYGWKFSLVLGAVIGSLAIISFGEFKFGPDLAGGITLIYELADPSALAAPDDAEAPEPPAMTDEDEAASEDAPAADAADATAADQETAADQQADALTVAQADTDGDADEAAEDDAEEDQKRAFDISQLIDALKERIDPSGTREVTIRPFGPAIEIIIPKTGPDALDYVKRRITDLGQLEFRITADPTQPRDRPIIEQAQLMPAGLKDVMLGGAKVAEWVAYAPEEFPPGDDRIITRVAGETPEALVLMDPMNVTGEYLTSTSKGVDERGGPAVHFSFNRAGAGRFRQLTSQNKPNPATGAPRYLGIVLDKRLISAPSINETISGSGIISGAAMGEEEVDYIVSILNAGSLPAALNKEPISEEIISPTLGAVTIEKGKMAIGASLVAVMLFMLVYYRFAGIVACLVLTLNLLLVLAIMVLIDAAFTLPGLAGLVLTVGMSVDANVLIYERIREELKHGAALRMAIRNGFSRAMSAIIDSNVTTIISGVALYAFATDQVKGFAVTLILGILTSMFTAIFCARVIFDVAERRGWVANIRMMQLLSSPNFDFLRVRYLAGGASLILILIGAAAAVDRGSQLFDIDFTGGSSITFVLNEPTPIDSVHETLSNTELEGRNLLVVRRGEGDNRYSVDTSIQEVDQVKGVLAEAFPGQLQTFSVEVRDVYTFSEGGFSGSQATLTVNDAAGFGEEDGVSYEAMREHINRSLEETGQPRVSSVISNPNYSPGTSARFKEWNIKLADLDVGAARAVFDNLEATMEATPLFPMASKIGGRVSNEMQVTALYAILISLAGVIAYLWLRFHKVMYGIAAAVAIVHDVLFTLGMLAMSAYVVQAVPGLAALLKIEAFQINLTIVAAVLTIMGYSLNDTIVTFDRLREIKGKSPQLTAEMVNRSVNQTLSRTLLTALTVFIVVAILYFFGGDGIHGFAFAFLVGTLAGTYSTIYMAAPVLLWLSGASMSARSTDPSSALQPAR